MYESSKTNSNAYNILISLKSFNFYINFNTSIIENVKFADVKNPLCLSEYVHILLTIDCNSKIYDVTNKSSPDEKLFNGYIETSIPLSTQSLLNY